MGDALKNRVAVITGSGVGIGKAVALAMAREGAKIIVNDIVSENAEAVTDDIQAIGSEAVPFVGDISDFNTAEKLIQTAIHKFKRIDILHNNAGIIATGPVWDFPEKNWDSVINVNLKGTFNCIRHALPYMMKQKWGRIINASSGARLGMAFNASYSASKAGVVALTLTVAEEMGPHGVTCNAYQPTAATRLTLNEEAIAGFKKAYESGAMEKDVYEMLINPPPVETIPPLLLYLCTEDSSNVNGKVFNILGDTISIYAEPIIKGTIFSKERWKIDELKHAVPNVLLRT